MPLMGYREYSRHAGVTLRTIQKAIEAGHIRIDADKKIDSDQADRDWKQNKDVNRVEVSILADARRTQAGLLDVAPEKNAAVPAAPRQGGDGAEQDQPETEADATSSEYRTHRASREKFSSLKQELEYKQLAGELISVEEAKRIAYTAFRAIRDSLLNVSARLKDQLAAQNDPHECERLLDAELSAALAGIDVGKLLQETDE
jgi:hypothetical protein